MYLVPARFPGIVISCCIMDYDCGAKNTDMRSTGNFIRKRDRGIARQLFSVYNFIVKKIRKMQNTPWRTLFTKIPMEEDRNIV